MRLMPTDANRSVRRAGFLTGATVAALMAVPLVAHADTDVPSHWEGTLSPKQEACLSDKGIKALVNTTATNDGARFRVPAQLLSTRLSNSRKPTSI
jgi:hypothetical protein